MGDPAPDRPVHKTVLFTGHMVDRADRVAPRFPATRVGVAGRAIADALAHLGAGSGDRGICGGACGGDLLFAEACLERGMALDLQLPFEEPAFLAASVSFAGPEWVDRYLAVKRHPATRFTVNDSTTSNSFADNNLAMLETAATGGGVLHLLCLYDGHAGDGEGGTEHLVNEVRSRGGLVHVLDTTRLW